MRRKMGNAPLVMLLLFQVTSKQVRWPWRGDSMSLSCPGCTVNLCCLFFSPPSDLYTHLLCQFSLRCKMSTHIEQNSDEARSSFISRVRRHHFLRGKRAAAAATCVQIAPGSVSRHGLLSTADIYSCPPTPFPWLRLGGGGNPLKPIAVSSVFKMFKSEKNSSPHKVISRMPTSTHPLPLQMALRRIPVVLKMTSNMKLVIPLHHRDVKSSNIHSKLLLFSLMAAHDSNHCCFTKQS